jgi:acetolactate synthase-1/2/3 large subunit
MAGNAAALCRLEDFGMTDEISCATAILRTLMRNGVDTVFGLPGGQLNHFFDAMYDVKDQIRYVGSRHEQGAAYMAFGYAKSTGRVGVYAVVPGPGLLNTTAAICSAYANNTPVLCVTGQIPSKDLGKGIGHLHELPDQLATMRTLTKWAERIMRPEDAPRVVTDAFTQLLSGRRRPVCVETPTDIMGARAAITLLGPAIEASHPALNPDAVDKAAALLAASKRPVILVGGGAIHTKEELLELAMMLQAPVVAFRNGRGIVSDRHFLSQSFVAGYELWKTTDVVLGVGTRMEQQYLHWGTDADMKIIRVDIDAEELSRTGTPEIGIHGDARDAIGALIDALPKYLRHRSSRQEELWELKQSTRKSIDVIQPQMTWLDAIREALPDDGYFIDEITQVGFASWYGFPVFEPRHLITCGYQGTLGYGFATALGVKVAHPDKPVVSISGDGGFLFNVQELATAAQHKINLVSIVFNNNQYGNVKYHQEAWFGGRMLGADLKNPNFVKLAESFGVKGVKANTPQRLIRAMRAGFVHDGPTLIEVPVGAMARPWQFIIRPRVRGAETPDKAS